MTQETVASNIKMSRQGFLSSIKTNKIGVDKLMDLATVLNVSVHEFFTDETINKKTNKNATVVLELQTTDILKIDLLNKKLEITKGK
jgi:outer membrane protein W